MLLKADVFKFSRSAARELDRGSGGGEPPPPEARRPLVVGGRCETQSWTSRDTLGFCRRLLVFLEEGLVVIIMVGVEE